MAHWQIAQGFDESNVSQYYPMLMSDSTLLANTIVQGTALTGALFTLSAIVMSPVAHAEHTHHVKSGQTLSSIAHTYHVSSRSLAAANGLNTSTTLKHGVVLKVPESGVIYVAAGQTLSSIATQHHTSIGALAKANRLRETSTLQIGQRLLLPGYSSQVLDASETRSTRVRKNRQPPNPRVSFYRLSTHERVKIRLTDSAGRVRSSARNQLAQLMRARGSRRTRSPHPRLVQLLSQVAHHFDAKTIHIISGYRPAGGYTSETSRHTMGRAMDIRVEGVPNHVLRDYVRNFNDVGVGYYPRSGFVHLDVRDRNAYWVDVSGPGEAPRLRRPARASSALAANTPEEEEDNTDTAADVPEEEAALTDALEPEDTEPNATTRASSQTTAASAPVL